MRIYTKCERCGHEWMRGDGVAQCPKCRSKWYTKSDRRGWHEMEIGDEIYLPFDMSKDHLQENLKQYRSMRSYCRKTGKVFHSNAVFSDGRRGLLVRRVS